MLLFFSSKAAVECLQETGKLIATSNLNCKVDNIPGDVIDLDLSSIKKHFEQNAWDQVIKQGKSTVRRDKYIEQQFS